MKKGIFFKVIFRIMGIVWLILGLRMIGEGVYDCIDEYNQEDWITTTGEVIDVSSEYSHSRFRHRNRVRYDIIYHYEVNGEAYSDVLYNRTELLGIGEHIQIKYDPGCLCRIDG